jgi:hypothetical protein
MSTNMKHFIHICLFKRNWHCCCIRFYYRHSRSSFHRIDALYLFFVFIKGKCAQWWSTIPPISTIRTTIPLTSNHWTQQDNTSNMFTTLDTSATCLQDKTHQVHVYKLRHISYMSTILDTSATCLQP